MKKVVFGITSLTLGGAERVLVDIVNKLKKEYEITIFTLYDNGEFKKELDKEIKVVSLFNKKYNELNFFQKKFMSLCMIFKFLRKKIFNKYIKGKYDVEISFLEGPITWLFSCKGDSKKIAWVHNDIKKVFGINKKSNLKQMLNKKCYEKYDELVFVSKDNLKVFNEMFKTNVKKRVIHNYLNAQSVIEKSKLMKPKEYDKSDINFVVVSRLTEQKGIDRLIKVHKKLIKEYPHKIFIVGEGPLKLELEKLIKDLKVNDTFKLLGKRENPYPYIKEASYFMLPSIYEGYGMVIEEAKILSKYILITNTAAREAVIDYPDSIIVKNSEDGIYEGMKKLIRENIQVKSKIKFNNEEIIKDITNVIGE